MATPAPGKKAAAKKAPTKRAPAKKAAAAQADSVDAGSLTMEQKASPDPAAEARLTPNCWLRCRSPTPPTIPPQTSVIEILNC